MVIVTGRDNQIMECWLPSIRNQGQYNGDILLLNYDLLELSVEKLQNEPNLTIMRAERVYKEISSDRIRAFYERLKNIWKNYDVIMMTDGDIEFFKPIAPLFELGKDKICYVQEKAILKDWGYHYDYYPYPNCKEIWETIKDFHMINMGMVVGPAKMIFEALKSITENLKLEATWGADQLLFNALIYYYKTFPSHAISNEWNFLSVYNHIKQNDKCFDENGREIAILHKIGTTWSPKKVSSKNILEGLSGIKRPRPPE